MMPSCDQTTMAVTIRAGGTVVTRMPSEPVLAKPMPTAAAANARSHSGTCDEAPTTASPVTTGAIPASRMRRGPNRALTTAATNAISETAM